MIATQLGKSLSLSNEYLETKHHNPRGRRRKITGFSFRSYSNFRLLLCSIDWNETTRLYPRPYWLTLTYDGKSTGAERCKHHLHHFCNKTLPRKGFRGPCIWKAELQKRQTIHFHLIKWGIDFDPTSMLSSIWHELTGSSQDAHLTYGFDAAPIVDESHLETYISKYISKDGDSSSWNHGRVWGAYDRKLLCLHENTQTQFMEGSTYSIGKHRLSQVNISLPKLIFDKFLYMEYFKKQLSLPITERESYTHFISTYYTNEKTNIKETY